MLDMAIIMQTYDFKEHWDLCLELAPVAQTSGCGGEYTRKVT